MRIAPATAASIVGIVFLLSYFDIQRRGEKTLLHNLGIPAVFAVAIATIPAAFAESAFSIAEKLVR